MHICFIGQKRYGDSNGVVLFGTTWGSRSHTGTNKARSEKITSKFVVAVMLTLITSSLSTEFLGSGAGAGAGAGFSAQAIIAPLVCSAEVVAPS